VPKKQPTNAPRKRSRHQPWYRPDVKAIAASQHARKQRWCVYYLKKSTREETPRVNNLLDEVIILTRWSYLRKRLPSSTQAKSDRLLWTKVTPRPWTKQWVQPENRFNAPVGTEEDSLGMSTFAINGGPCSIHCIHSSHENVRAVRRYFPVRNSWSSTDDFRDRVCLSRGERECARQRSGRDRYLEFAQVEDFLKFTPRRRFLFREKRSVMNRKPRPLRVQEVFIYFTHTRQTRSDFDRWH